MDPCIANSCKSIVSVAYQIEMDKREKYNDRDTLSIKYLGRQRPPPRAAPKGEALSISWVYA